MKVTNRFKELDLIDRVPEELCTEIHNRVQEAVIKTIPKKKKCKKAKWCSEETLQRTEKRRAAKGKRKKGNICPTEGRDPKNRRTDKKAFLSEQCKEIEKNSKIRKTIDLFKKIRDT